MSSVINPVGPEEPSTYWRRRAAVVVALLVVLWLAWWLLSTALGGSDEQPSDGASPTPGFGLSMSPEPDASGGSSPAPASSGDASPGPSGSASATAPACSDEDIAVTASAASAAIAVGASLELTLNVENTSSEACTRDLGPGANELRVTSGEALVWSSDFCSPSTESEVVTLDPGEGRSASATWPGTIVTEGCPSDQPAAQPGTYRVIARNGSVESEPVTFVVQ